MALNRFFSSTRDNPIPIEDDQESTLTSLVSGETPTLDDGIAPSMEELERAQKAHDDAAFKLVINRIPQDHKCKIGHTLYFKYDPYRPKRSHHNVWYWAPDQAEELVTITKGILPLFLRFSSKSNIYRSESRS